MNLDQSYTILELKPGAGLEDVKSSYRRLAFRYHPDLNPEDPRASANFQRLNEAFVLLRNHIQMQGPSAEEEPSTTRKEAPGDRGSRKGTTGFYSTKEEVLKDILSDPFAKRVFEDIYREIKRTKSGKRTNRQGPAIRRQKNIHVELGKKTIDLDVSRGYWSGFKKWLKSQMDDEQVIYLPPMKLLPGSKIRIQVKHRWAGPPKNVDVTIPRNYVIGRPIRLQGMGRKLGPWKGDLYLRLMAK